MTKPIISFVILVLSIGFAFLYVIPAYNLNVERRGDIESLTKILSTSSEIKTLIDQTKTNLGSIERSGLDRFEVFLPERIDPIRFANNIQYIGRKNRIILSDIKVEGSVNGVVASTTPAGVTATQGFIKATSLGAQIGKAEGAYDSQSSQTGVQANEKFATTKANFSFTSTFETFQSFLDDLEKSLGVIDVTSLSFSQVTAETSASSPRTPPPPTYQYAMTIETYSLK